MGPRPRALNYTPGNQPRNMLMREGQKTCPLTWHARVLPLEGDRVMLPCQRALFDMPREVCFLNAAAWSPLPLASQEAGRAAVGRKGRPWKLPDGFQAGQYERARK